MVESEIIMHFGWASVVIAVAAGAFSMWRWPMDRQRTFSENIGRKQVSARLFAWWLTTATVLHYWFLLAWLGPARGMGSAYYIVVWLMFLLQLVAAWVPATHSRSLTVHSITAYGVALLMPFAIGLLAFSGPVDLNTLQLLFVGGLMGYILVTIFLVLRVTAVRMYALWLQVGVIILVWATILTLAYS